MHHQHQDHREMDDDEKEWCEKVPPPLRIFAWVGEKSECCIASGKRESDLFVDQSIVPAEASARGLQIGIGGLGIAAGAVKAQGAGGSEGINLKVLHNEDNVVQTTTFNICWKSCGGYPGKHVDLTIAEMFPPTLGEEVARREVLNQYTCLPPSSPCCDCCCLTFVIKTCHTLDELRDPVRIHRKLHFEFKVVDGAGKSEERSVPAIEP